MGKINRENFSESFNNELDKFEKPKGGIPLGNVSDITISSINDKVYIKWKDPGDVSVLGEDGTSISLSEWAGTKLVYKNGSVPTSPEDGVLVLDNKVRNAYQNTPFIIDNLTVGSTYHFMLFPYTTKDTYTVSDENSKRVTIKLEKLGNATITSANTDGNVINIKWKDPEDVIKIIDGEEIVAAHWAGTKVIRKIGSVPNDVNDGILIVDSKIRDAYSTVAYVDSEIDSAMLYYYRLFPYTTTGAMTDSDSTSIGAKDFVPGPSELIAGNNSAGFFGEVPSSEFITGDLLALTVGITDGISQYSDTPWLKFMLDGKILFIPKKPIRHSISWDNIDGVGAVFGSNIIIGNNTYEVRLMKGAQNNPSNNNDADRDAIGSEWNRLMLPIHEQAKTKAWESPAYVGNDVPDWGIGFTDADLHTYNTYGNGSYTWCQETAASDGTSRVFRGYHGVSYSGWKPSADSHTYYGWRPVLELVPQPLEDTTGSPGAKKTIARDKTAGFFGEVLSNNFISGSALISKVNLTKGVLLNSNIPWLKFIIDGKIVFIPKKPISYGMSWDDLNAAGLVDGSKTIMIGNITYKVRLIKGAQNNPSNYTDADRDAIGSEWNRLMLPIHEQAKTKAWAYPAYTGTDVPDWGIGYKDADLHTYSTSANGSLTWCQETIVGDNKYRVHRGMDGVSYSGWVSSNTVDNHGGWRPVLEVVPSYEDTSGAPGPTKTIARGETAGFFGEVPASEFITGDALANAVGFVEAVSINSDTNWLKFMMDGKILFIPKKPLKTTLSVNQLIAKNIVKGDVSIKIGNHMYKVRLMKGLITEDVLSATAKNAIGSEWNRLILPIHAEAPNQWTLNGILNDAYAGTTEDWGIDYTDADLSVRNTTGDGHMTICQEMNSERFVLRGETGVSSLSTRDSLGAASTGYGWRPVLELVPPFEDTSGSPGPTKTIAQGATAGFFGEVPVNEFITGDALATTVGLTVGESQYSDTPWLKFVMDGKILFIPKKPLRNNISWNDLRAKDLVYGDKVINIGENKFKVRLIRGSRTNLIETTAADYGAIGSEWNRLLLPIHVDAPNNWKRSGAPDTKFGGSTDDWGINYTDEDISNAIDGVYNWCIEASDNNAGAYGIRGYNGITELGWAVGGNVGPQYGWRPVLELLTQEPFEDTSGSPGSTKTIARGATAGFFGEVPSSQFITGDALSAAVGLAMGTSQNSSGPWLKFIIDGKILFTPMKPIRYGMAYIHLRNLGIIDGSKRITFGGNTYKVRLWEGARGNNVITSEADKGAIGTEWNRLMLPIHANAPDKWTYPLSGGVSEDWGLDYSNKQLMISSSLNGTYTWCQGSPDTSATYAPQRGGNDVSAISQLSISSSTAVTNGWRPVLELVPPHIDNSGSPGPTRTVGQDETAGFFGEVPSEQFITGDALAEAVGLTAGTSMNTSTKWLKFILDGKILFTPKRPIRQSISWDNLYVLNIVFGTYKIDKTIEIGGKVYKVRLFKGAVGNAIDSTLIDKGAIGSEWNRLMLPIHVEAPDKWKMGATSDTRFGGISEDWNINYIDSDLGVNSSSYAWCQEPLDTNSSSKSLRGGNSGISDATSNNRASSLTSHVWRPVLELLY